MPTSLRGEDDARQCLLVIIGVRRDGTKELVAIGDGLRESKASWLELLRDLKNIRRPPTSSIPIATH